MPATMSPMTGEPLRLAIAVSRFGQARTRWPRDAASQVCGEAHDLADPPFAVPSSVTVKEPGTLGDTLPIDEPRATDPSP